MVYKFDILFKKALKNGGLKVVTYSSLLKDPEVFGKGEELTDVEGELSMVLEGPEEGFSINALYRKYRSQLVGSRNAELLGKDILLRFAFANAYDPYSIKMALYTDDGNTYSLDTAAFELLVPKDSDCTITSGAIITCLQIGQVAFTTTPVAGFIINPAGVNLIRVI